jgi:periplasmic divalent cation tolerance protein
MTTVGSEEQAISIAEELVHKKLSACVNIVPAIRSIYYWKDEVCNDEELLLIIKSIPEKFEEIHAVIRELHSYDLPECVAIDLQRGCPEYLDWIIGTVTTPEEAVD